MKLNQEVLNEHASLLFKIFLNWCRMHFNEQGTSGKIPLELQKGKIDQLNSWNSKTLQGKHTMKGKREKYSAVLSIVMGINTNYFRTSSLCIINCTGGIW